MGNQSSNNYEVNTTMESKAKQEETVDMEVKNEQKTDDVGQKESSVDNSTSKEPPAEQQEFQEPQMVKINVIILNISPNFTMVQFIYFFP